ncbi:MAG TPA: hypothetical protein VMA53_17595 [Stellaceae bacterium]|nr:hypothetical protein [Stellaceae bacterium]
MSALAQTPTPPAPASSPPVMTQATGLLDLMMRLADLLAHETERVRAGQVQDVGPLQAEKLRLSVLYQRAAKDLQASGTKITDLPVPVRAQIVATSSRLAEAATKNELALRVGRDATRRLLDMVVRSMRDRLKPVSRYDARRTPKLVRMAPCAVDRRL